MTRFWQIGRNEGWSVAIEQVGGPLAWIWKFIRPYEDRDYLVGGTRGKAEERRSGRDRRVADLGADGAERRSEEDRRERDEGMELIWWKHRRHSALLLRPAFNLMAMLVIAVWLRLESRITQTSIFSLMVIASAIQVGRHLLFMWRAGRPGGKPTRRAKRNRVWFGVAAVLGWYLRGEVDLIAALAVGYFAFRFISRAIQWAFYERLIVTDRRVIGVFGIIGKRVATMPLFRITDVEIRTSAISELLGYSIFRIESAGQDQALGVLNYLDDADRFHRLVIELATAQKPLIPENAMVEYRNKNKHHFVGPDDDDPDGNGNGSGLSQAAEIERATG